MKDGVYEVWLSSEDTGAYGLDVKGVVSVDGVDPLSMDGNNPLSVDGNNPLSVDGNNPSNNHTINPSNNLATTKPTHPLNITHLLKSVSSIMTGNGGDGTMVRLGMTNPPYILQHLDDIATFLRQPNVFSFLHIPVQSGSNRVLKAMQREYTVEDFCTVVDVLQVPLLLTLNPRKPFPASRSQRTL